MVTPYAGSSVSGPTSIPVTRFAENRIAAGRKLFKVRHTSIKYRQHSVVGAKRLPPVVRCQ